MTDQAERESAPTSLRPSPQAYRRALAVSAPVPLFLTLRNVLDDDVSWSVDLAIIGGTVVMMGALLVLFFRVSRVQTRGDALVKRSLSGRTRVVPYAEIGTVLLVPCYRRFNTPTTTLLAFLDREGRALLRLDGIHWDSVALRRLAAVVGAPVVEIDGERTPSDLRRSWPRALNLIERRPVLVWTTLAVLMALAIGFAALARIAGWA